MGIIKKILGSFDNTSDGFSARKLSAFITVHTAIVCAYRIVTPENGQYIIGILLLFALLALGIVTAEQIIRYKDGLKAPAEAAAKQEVKDATKKLDDKVEEL